jgi:hypothetical protein
MTSSVGNPRQAFTPNNPAAVADFRLLALDLGALIRLVAVEGGADAMNTEQS